jgi:outer membrane protein TolC
MRWKSTVIGLTAAMAFALGCKQQCFLYECDSTEAYRRLGLTPQLENDPTPSIVPSVGSITKPPTINDSERPPRYISLAEAIAMALEYGDPGTQQLNGTVNDDPALLTGRVRTASTASNIRVLSLNPAIVGPDIEAALSKFDARWETSMNWTTTDQPTQGLSSFQNGDQAIFQTSLLKPLPTGGVAGITFNTTYQNLSSPPTGFQFTNPAYTPKLTFQFEQPLLQGYGVEINQLRSTHPGSILTPFNTASRVEGILITRIRLDEERLDFERQVHTLLVNVEAAYWNLYFSYWNLYSREKGLQFALESWRVSTERYQKGAESLASPATARGQYEQFRGQRLAALDQVLENEHQLRRMIGMPVSDGSRLVPIDTPTLAPYEPDWTTALNEMLALRPGLGQARQDLKFRQLDLISQKNLLLPDLRFTSSIAPNGLGNTLSGSSSSLLPSSNPLAPTTPSPANAFHSLATGDFVNWGLGLRLDVAIGYRDANAAVRSARLSLAQSYLTLRDLESRYTGFLEQQYRAVSATYEQIRALRAQREAAAQQVRVRFDIYRLGARVQGGQQPIEFLLDAQRLWADALRDEYQAIVNYNNALSRFEYAKGTIMQHDNVVIAEGGLPQCAQVRAVEHERERSHALVLKERAKPITAPCCRVEGGTITGLPELPPSEAPSLPALFEGQAGLEKMPERLPSNPADLPKPTTDVTKPADDSKPNMDLTKPETSAAGPVSSLIPPSADNNRIIGAPTAANQASPTGSVKEPGAYQIPAMPVASATGEGAMKAADTPVAVTTTSTSPDSSPVSPSKPTQWNHPERLQRSRWRESLGETPSSN